MVAEAKIRAALREIKRGKRKEYIIAKYGREIYEFAAVRLRHRAKFKKPVYMDLEGFRYATHEAVARFRAKVATGRVVADLSCGCGMQAIFFAKYAEKVYAVDISEKMVRYAMMNSRLYGVNNMEFIVGDALCPDVCRRVRDADFVYSDPARPAGERVRSMQTLQPSPLRIIELYKQPYMFDLPPQIERGKIAALGRLEYISLHGKINRLTLYSEEIAPLNTVRWAVALPEGAILCHNDRLEERALETCEEPLAWIFEVDHSVYYAGLLPELTRKYGVAVLYKSKRRTFVTADHLRSSPFLRRAYRPISGPYTALGTVFSVLKKTRCCAIELRFAMPPENYKKIRTAALKAIRTAQTAATPLAMSSSELNCAILGWHNRYYLCERVW